MSNCLRKDLVIDDDEFISFASQINYIGNQIDEKVSILIGILSDVAEKGIKEGVVHDNLILYIEQLRKLEGQVGIYTLNLIMGNNKYIELIDKHDRSLYEV